MWAGTITRGQFTIWMAGGGVKPGMTHGQTDEMGYEIVKDPRRDSRPACDDCCICWGSTITS